MTRKAITVDLTYGGAYSDNFKEDRRSSLSSPISP
ncbi:hypothetical protein [Enterobacter phage 01_vB_Eclo_IJM]|nr:hypothetical protein [Enterobacter phage 01_vB_Eclo_IJM]